MKESRRVLTIPSRRWRSALFVLIAFITVPTPVAGQTPHPVLDASGFQQNRDYFSEAPFEHIDTLSGGLVLRFTDLVLPGNAGRELRFQRTYNSKPTGRWTFGIAGVALKIFDPPLLPPTAQDPQFQQATPVLLMGDGSEQAMAWLERPITALPNTMRWAISREFWRYDRTLRELHIPDGTRCQYQPGAQNIVRLSRCTDSFGNAITAVWDLSASPAALVVSQFLNGPPESATEVRTIAFTLDPSDFPMSMTFEGRTWTYHGVTSVSPPAGAGWTYTYGTPGGLLQSVTTPHGGLFSYTYVTQPYAVVEPGGQGFTTVVTSRTTGGRLEPGTWNYAYNIGLEGLSSVTTVTTPSHRLVYTHGGQPPGTEDMVFDGKAGAVPLAERLVQRRQGNGNNWRPVERETRTYTRIDVLPWARFGTLEPDIRTITRYDGSQTRDYTTNYDYSGADFGDYHRPNLITESGEAGTRTTARTFTHLSGPYLVALPTTEQVTVGGETYVRSWTYDGATGFRTSETVYDVTTAFAPDGFGNVATIERANGKQTAFTYQWGLLKDTITAAHTTTRVINPEGTVAEQTQGGRTTTFGYDDLFRVQLVRPPGGTNPTVTTYDPNGAWVRVTRGPFVETTDIDGLGRPVGSVNSVATRTRTRYDAEGRRIYESYPFTTSDIGTTIAYDALGRVTRRTNPAGSFVDWAYGLGTITIRDEENRTIVRTLQAFGDPDRARLVSVKDAANKTWVYSYTGLDQLRQVTAPDGTRRTWEYIAGTNRLFRESHPESGATTFGYDAAGVFDRKTDARGTTFVYTLDGNDRVTAISAGGRTTTLTYEPGSDNRASASVAGVSTTFSFDLAGRLSGRTDSINGKTFTTMFGYDGNDNVTSIDYPSVTGSRRLVRFDTDAAGRVTRAFQGARDYASSLQYHPSGSLQAFTSGNGVQNTVTYDANRYWPTSIAAGPLSLTYQNYDKVGNVRSIADNRPGQSQTLSYDALDRLSTAAGVYGKISYPYDAHGNRTSSGTTYVYDPATLRLVQQGSTVFGYDANGNVISDGAKTYTYTPDNMLETVAGGPAGVAYAYDGDLLRVLREEGGIPTFFLRGPNGELLTEWRSLGSTAQVRDYIYAGPRLVATVSRDVTEGPPSGICSVTTDIVDLDFESGASLAALGFTPVIDISNQSGEGLNGSTWGVRGNPGASSSAKYYGEARLPVTHSGRNFKLEALFDHADAGHNRFGYSAFEMWTNGGGSDVSYLSLYHGVGDAGTDRDKLQLYLAAEPGGYSTPEWELGGLIFPGTPQRITVCGTLSTVSGTTINPDGSVHVLVDGILQASLTGKRIGTTDAFGGGSLKKVQINPMGRFDNFKVSQ